jgi:hypothetical protein
MPVIEINALPQKSHVDIEQTVKSIAIAVAEVLRIPSNKVFCTWNEINKNYYSAGETVAAVQPDSSHPPIVKLTLYEGRTPALIEGAISAIAEELQKSMKSPEKNAFISYLEAKSGQIFTGGQIKRT